MSGGDRDDDDKTDPDPIERRLAVARERIRQVQTRLNTREHALIDPRPRSAEDDLPTRPLIVPRKP